MTDKELFGNSEQLASLADSIETMIDYSEGESSYDVGIRNGMRWCLTLITKKEPEYEAVKPSAQPEPLTDKEQRIFLAAMEREEKVCEEVDRNYVREPYEDSLMRVCKEIRRKVKGALWT